MIAFRGQNKVGPRPDWSPSGFNSKFPTSILDHFIWESPPGPETVLHMENFVSLFKASVFDVVLVAIPVVPLLKPPSFTECVLYPKRFMNPLSNVNVTPTPAI